MKNFAIFFLLFSFFSNLYAQKVLTIEDLYNNIIKTKHNIKILDDYLNVDNKNYKIEKAYSSNLNGLYSQNNYNFSIVIRQLLNTNQVLSPKQTSKLLEEEEKFIQEDLNEALFYHSSILYFKILTLQKSLNIAKSRKNLILEVHKLISKREKLGISIEKDLDKLENELTGVNLDMLRYQEEITLKINELKTILKIEEEITLRDYAFDEEFFKIDEKLVSSYLLTNTSFNKFSNFLAKNFIDNSTQLEILIELIKAKEEIVSKKITNQSSLLKSSTSFDSSKKEYKPWEDNEFEKIVNEKLYLYKDAKVTIKSEQNKAELQNLIFTSNNTKTKILKNIRLTLEKVLSYYKTIQYTNISNQNATNNYYKIRALYENGTTNIQAVLNAQNSMLIALINKYSANYDYLLYIITTFYDSKNIELLIDKKKKEIFVSNLKATF
ncbi:hypothetical protein CRU99_07675 [Malaciobacter mytili]|uniref:hypothetical protein n=1 Tax=Malaciobacter mytili TaxID=603050 RepID=UPI00100AC0F8|nr:hypothetical protein [Malaciobacter mytili]RXI43404.1 hypothetical protein CRU99_07675 [Malaciobacter mytili]